MIGAVSGWISVAMIVSAGAVPVAARIYAGKRPPPESQTTRSHVVLGMIVCVVAFAHTGVVLPMVGAPGALAGGMLGMIPACAAFGTLVAHAGLGLQLRRPKLKDRIRKRRMHATTAALIVLGAGVHIAAMLASPR
jgi:hypothetical protein